MGNKKRGYRYTENDLKINFNNLKNELGHIPLFSEFKEFSEISDTTYATRLGLKGKRYDKIVEFYVSKDDYENYINQKLNHKTQVGKKTGALSCMYTDEHMATNLRYIFDICMNKYGSYPSRRCFDKVSPIDSSLYRNRFKLSWAKLCRLYGYSLTSKNKEETLCLGMCKEILKHDYIPQKTWSWLIGVGGKHMYCDGYFPNSNLVVEFDGVGHRKPIDKFGGVERFAVQLQNDSLKDKLLKENGIKVIRIDSRINWQSLDLLRNIIINQLNQ